MGGQQLRVGVQQFRFLPRQGPGGAGNGVVAVAAGKHVAREAFVHLGPKTFKKLVDFQDGVVSGVAGVGGGNLLVPNQ